MSETVCVQGNEAQLVLFKVDRRQDANRRAQGLGSSGLRSQRKPLICQAA